MASFVQNLLNQNRKRAIGTVMRHIEQNVYPSLTPAQRAELRAKVIGSFEVYHDNCLDIVKASVNDGVLHNEEVLVVLRRMESALHAENRTASRG